MRPGGGHALGAEGAEGVTAADGRPRLRGACGARAAPCGARFFSSSFVVGGEPLFESAASFVFGGSGAAVASLPQFLAGAIGGEGPLPGVGKRGIPLKEATNGLFMGVITSFPAENQHLFLLVASRLLKERIVAARCSGKGLFCICFLLPSRIFY